MVRTAASNRGPRPFSESWNRAAEPVKLVEIDVGSLSSASVLWIASIASPMDTPTGVLKEIVTAGCCA